MAATYFSSSERRMNRGLGRLDTFLEDSTSFLSGKGLGGNYKNQSQEWVESKLCITMAENNQLQLQGLCHRAIHHKSHLC